MCCSLLKRLLAETLQRTLHTFPRHAGASCNLCFLTQIPLCSSSIQSSPDSSYPAFPMLLVNTCALWITLEWSLCLSFLGELTENGGGVDIFSTCEQTNTAMNNISVSTWKETCSSEQNQSGWDGEALLNVPKANQALGYPLARSVMWVFRDWEKGNVSHWIKAAKSPTLSWKYKLSGMGLHNS